MVKLWLNSQDVHSLCHSDHNAILGKGVTYPDIQKNKVANVGWLLISFDQQGKRNEK